MAALQTIELTYSWVNYLNSLQVTSQGSSSACSFPEGCVGPVLVS